MSAKKIPGLSLVYISDGKIQETYALGRTNSKQTIMVKPTTVFSAASLSKPVFAYAVMLLVAEKKLNLDTPLYRYYPWPDLQHDARNQLITARMVLSHTSGLPNWRKKGDTLRFMREPGTAFGYSGEGYVYLSRVVEKITGKPVEEMMQERIFKPLAMTRSSYLWQKRFEPDFAEPHDRVGNPQTLFRPEDANVAASMQTTAEDFARFLLAFMQGKGLGKDLLNEMYKPQPHSKLQKSDDQLWWALGLAYQKTDEGITYWQWGDNGNFKAWVMISPENKSGVVYFTNSANGLDITTDITSLYFKGPQPALKWLASD